MSNTKTFLFYILFAFGLLVSFPSSAAAAISLVQSNSTYPGGTGPTGLAFSSNNTAGNLIVVGVQGANNSADPTITDTRGNTYVKVGSVHGGSGTAYSYLYYAKNIAAGANTVTVTLPNGNDLGFHISEWSGVDTTSPFNASSSDVATSSVTVWSTTNLTTTAADTVLIAFTGTENSAETFTAGTNFTKLTEQTSHSSMVQYRIVSSAGTYRATATVSNADNAWVMIMGAFKAANTITPTKVVFNPFSARSKTFFLDPPAFNSISGYTSSTSFKELAAGGQPADGFSSSTSYKPCAGQLCTFFLTNDPNPASIAYLTGYRWYSNADAVTTGSTLAATNATTTAPAQGTPLRLRAVLHMPVDYSIGPTSSTLPVSGINNTVTGATAWTNTNNVTSSDNSYATVVLPNATLPSNYIEAKNFGFSLPASSTITGIYVEVDRKDDGSKLKDAFVSIFKTDGSPNLGTASTSFWTSTEQTATYGGQYDLWSTSFTAADINSPDFGFGIGVWGDSVACAGGCTASVDAIRVTVYYQPENLKLQYAAKSGTCDTAFSGETYVDVATSSGAIRFYNNTTPSDNDTITASSSDPTHGTDTVVAQTYQESNNFGVTSTVPAGNDGLWDFSLVDYSATANTDYCFRVVSSSGATSTPDYVPEFTTAAAGAGITISGTVYSDAGITTTTSSVSLSINGGTKTTVSTNGSGVFTFSSVTTPNAADVITVWMDNNGGGNGTGATVTRYSGSGDLTGLDIYRSRMIVRHEDAGPIINTDIDACTKTLGAGCADSDIHFDVSGGALTVDSDWGLYVWGGDTFTPGGAVTLTAGAASSTPGGDLTWGSSSSTLSMSTNALSVGGDWRNDVGGTATITSSAVTFTATQPGMVINSGNKNFGSVTFNGVGGTWSASTSQMVITGSTGLTMTAGTLNNVMGSAPITVSGNGNVVGSGTGDGVISLTSSKFIFRPGILVSRNFASGNTVNWSFYDLEFNGSNAGGASFQNSSAASTTITVSNVLTIGSSTDSGATTFAAGSSTFVLSGTTGTPFVITSSPAATFTSASSTFQFSGNYASGNTQIPGVGYYKLVTNNASETYNITGNASTSDSLTVTAGTFDIATSSFVIGDGLTVSSGATFTGSNNVTLTVATSTASFLGTTNFTGGTFSLFARNSDKTIDLGSASASTTLNIMTIDSVGISPTVTFSGTGGGLRTLGGLSIGSIGIVTLAVTTSAPFTIEGNFNNTVNGTFNASSSVALTFKGNFLSDGTLTTASSTFIFTGSSGTATIGGAAAFTFYNLSLLAPTATRTYQFTSGKTYYVNGALNIAGTSSSVKAVISASTGSVQWLINHQGTENVQFANIIDSGCDALSTNISVMSADNLDNGNNGTCWLFQTLAMTLSTTTISLPLTSGNTWTTTASNTLTVTSTVESGYNVTAFASGLLTSGLNTISDWPSSYSAPTTWAGTCSGSSQCGFGYNTDDADLTQFSGSKYAAFSSSTPGDIIATKSTSARGDQTTITYRVSVPTNQAAGTYTNSLNFVLTQQF